MDEKEAKELLNKKVREIYQGIEEAKKIADEHGLEFTIHIRSYGISGRYLSKEAAIAAGYADECGNDLHDGYLKYPNWVSSSDFC